MTSLQIKDQTTSSITLSWTAPQGPDHPPYTYWVSWTMEGGVATGPQNTLDTRITVSAMEAGSLYTFTVWAERNWVNSSKETRTGATGETLSRSGPSTTGLGGKSEGACCQVPERQPVLCEPSPASSDLELVDLPPRWCLSSVILVF